MALCWGCRLQRQCRKEGSSAGHARPQDVQLARWSSRSWHAGEGFTSGHGVVFCPLHIHNASRGDPLALVRRSRPCGLRSSCSGTARPVADCTSKEQGSVLPPLPNTGYLGFSAPEARDTPDFGPNRPQESGLPGIPRHWKPAGADRPGIFIDPARIGAQVAIALAVDCERLRCPYLIPSASPQDSRSVRHPLFLVQNEVPTRVSARTGLYTRL